MSFRSQLGLGQRILKDQTVSPIFVVPGDAIKVTYVGPYPSRERVLVTEEFTRPMKIDRLIVYEHDGFLDSKKCVGVAFLEMEELL